jgi:hypothetical protein
MDLRLNLSVNLSFDLNFCLPVVKDGVSVPEGNLMERYSAILIIGIKLLKGNMKESICINPFTPLESFRLN